MLFRLLQELFQPWQQLAVNVPGPAFPDDKHRPAVGSQSAAIDSIATHVSKALAAPEDSICCWLHFSEATSMHVPETAMHEDHLSMNRKDKVWLSRQPLDMQAKTETHLMDQ